MKEMAKTMEFKNEKRFAKKHEGLENVLVLLCVAFMGGTGMWFCVGRILSFQMQQMFSLWGGVLLVLMVGLLALVLGKEMR